MSDYTPTAEDVRDAYREGRDVALALDFGEGGDAAADAEFDRWLAAERARVWDEGHEAGVLNQKHYYDWDSPIRNPYEETP